MINPIDLTGKTILVTGASSGIGRETSVHLSKLGANIIMIARNIDNLKGTLSRMEGKAHKIYSYDLKKIEGIETLVQNIVDLNGPLNGFVHCAGISIMRPVKLIKYDFLHEMMLINFYSFVELVRCLSKKSKSKEGASFLGISSVAANKGNKSQGAYSASKAALDSIIKPMAKELSNRKIRVNTILFGMIKTEMYKGFLEQGGDTTVWNDQYMGIGETIDAANAIAFLLSDASKFITGTGLVVDGGYLS
ncbi:MAG: SDR family NAD(P)-dependent oxidoreductase [Candidatus Delongbacteria bacterium]|jgi:NAD(P)-dependent dehydrogenase (short-subunit alcohol dehydrogenase family)|nr:SDR family NAD(P)-dependent oxidoreductase [Candidatus Delongbacteria bacterium]